MADIRIEKKESSSIWPWILGLLVAGLAVWGIAELFDEGEEMMAENDIEIVDDVADRGTEIVESGNTYSLINFDDETIGKDWYKLGEDYEVYTVNMTGEMGLDHEFSHNALNKLANTTAALAAAHGMTSDVNMKAKKDKIRMAAEEITKDPYATNHADMIKMAAMNITDALETIQEAKYPGFEGAIAEVRNAAQDISKATLTLNQKEDVRDFFGKARVAIKGMRDYDVKHRGLDASNGSLFGGADQDGMHDHNKLDAAHGANTDPDNIDRED